MSIAKLQEELQSKGYTFFKMQDYPEFADDYIEYKEYVCNENKNLLKYIDHIKLDGNYLKSYAKDPNKTDFHISDSAESFEKLEEKINKEYLPIIDKNHMFQFWYFGQPNQIMKHFEKISNKIVEKLYNESKYNLKHMMSLTYYKSECFLNQHRDGKVGTRLCAVLIYLNDENYNPDWGGNIVFEGKETVDPIYGNIAVLDFKEGNCLHEVKKVIDGYGRYAILDFVSLGESVDTPNYY